MNGKSAALMVRDYRVEDSGAVVALWQELLADDAPHNEAKRALAHKVAIGDDLLLVATRGGALVGTVMGGYDGHRGWVYAVAVSPSHQRQGVATALLARLETRLAERGCLKVNLQVRATNQSVVAFYESLGYRVEQRVSMGKRLY